MEQALAIAQLISGGLVVVLILLQKKGVGLGAAFGGEGNFYRKRRGAEKIVFRATVLFVFIFVASSFVIAEVL